MALLGQQLSVGTTPTQLADGSQASANIGKPVALKNQGSASVFLGGASVAASGASAGYELKAGDSIGMTLFGDILFAIAASGTVRVDVLKGRH